MKGGAQVSPVVVGVIIVVVVAVAGIFLWKSTGSQGRVELNPQQVQQMGQMMGQRPAAAAGPMGRNQTSQPPTAIKQ